MSSKASNIVPKKKGIEFIISNINLHLSSLLRTRPQSPILLRLIPLLLQTILLSASQQLQMSRLDRKTLLRHSDETGCEFLRMKC
jgi:hypothetical protein